MENLQSYVWKIYQENKKNLRSLREKENGAMEEKALTRGFLLLENFSLEKKSQTSFCKTR